MTRSGRIGAVLLAAGASSRMGEPKQLLPWRGDTLVGNAAAALHGADCLPIVVVLGHEAARVRDALRGRPLVLVEHPDWRAGLGSSLRAGVAALLAAEPALDAMLVMLCDQPHVDAAALARLLDAYEARQPAIAASSYAGTRGVPAVFARAVLPELQRIEPAAGAKALLAREGLDVLAVDLPEAAHDVDTRESYDRACADLATGDRRN